MRKRWLLYLFFCPLAVLGQPTDDLELGKMMEPADPALFVRDMGYFNWCNSVIRDEAGKYHLFYSRWPRSAGFHTWLTGSEIAHAVAERPDGPYGRGETVIKGRPGYWDAITAHNVKVERFGKKYYMYYTATNSGDKVLTADTLSQIGHTGYGHRYWMLLRNNQRTGVATASSLDASWKRRRKPLIAPHGAIRNVTVNPAVCEGPDGRFYMIIKGDAPGSRKLIQACGVSERPDGPFVLNDRPAFADIPTEDVSMWYDKGRKRFYAIFHAHGGDFLGLITSEDGMNWQKAAHYEVCKKVVPLKDGSLLKVDRMERPFVYLEEGQPRMLSVAVKKGNESFIVFFNLKTDE